VFGPLAMHRTTFDPSLAGDMGLSQGYASRRGIVEPVPTTVSRAYNPAGMLVSTARDIGNYLEMLTDRGQYRGARLIGGESLQTIWTPVASTGTGLDYGLGWFLGDMAGERVATHAGGTLTMGSALVVAPEHGLAVAVLANRDDETKAEIAEGVMTLLLGGQPILRDVPARRGQNAFVPDRAVWEAYVGDYESPDGILRINRDGETLRGKLLSFDFELEALNDTQFVLHSDTPRVDGSRVEFQQDPDGSMVFVLQGQRYGVRK
jgi:CubicO group peptidase (beta-lactamase class C family)